MAYDIYNPVHIRETKKFSSRCLYAHGQTDANCKTFDRLEKSQKHEVCLLENFDFLIEKNFTAHLSRDIILMNKKKLLTNFFVNSKFFLYGFGNTLRIPSGSL